MADKYNRWLHGNSIRRWIMSNCKREFTWPRVVRLSSMKASSMQALVERNFLILGVGPRDQRVLDSAISASAKSEWRLSASISTRKRNRSVWASLGALRKRR